ncbi:MAG: hypothetical protein KJ630_11120 [Proteobacteria bacterium]|nr:hypothetical protein [Pseudomonadota bacterium]
MTTLKSLPLRMFRFGLSLGLMLTFVYVLLPALTGSCSILQRMSLSLDETGIDPSRYYYTDVEQVKESEIYLQTVLYDD